MFNAIVEDELFIKFVEDDDATSDTTSDDTDSLIDYIKNDDVNYLWTHMFHPELFYGGQYDYTVYYLIFDKNRVIYTVSKNSDSHKSKNDDRCKSRDYFLGKLNESISENYKRKAIDTNICIISSMMAILGIPKQQYNDQIFVVYDNETKYLEVFNIYHQKISYIDIRKQHIYIHPSFGLNFPLLMSENYQFDNKVNFWDNAAPKNLKALNKLHNFFIMNP